MQDLYEIEKAPGRVQEGGTPSAQLGGKGERRKLPHQGLGRSPRSQHFFDAQV